MSQVYAGDGAILKGADVVAETRETLATRISAVEGHMLAIGAGWQGAAADAFRQLMQQWNDDSSKVKNALVEFEQNLRDTQSTLDATDQNQVDAISKVAGILGANR